MRIAITITADDVRAEAERRITTRYPVWKQLNLLRAGGAEAYDMGAFVDAIRAASNRLERLPRIPANYRDDHHWD